MTVTEAPVIVAARVRGQAHVLGLNFNQVADLPITTTDLQACIDRGLVQLLAFIDADGNLVDAPEGVPEPTARPCGCGQ